MSNTVDNPLSGKIAVVTGGSRGIGKSIALTFAEAGADVVVCSRKNISELEEVAQEIQALGRRAVAIAANVAQKTEVDSMIEKTLEQFGCIDILVNNAGIMYRKSLLETTEQEWDETIDTDLKGYYLCAQAVSQGMMERKQGNIINLSSRLGIKANTPGGAYCVAKAGVVMLTQVLALELAGYNVRVNAIAPGLIKTEMSAALWSAPEVFEQIRQAIPLGRMANTGEIARVALFLASDASSYTTGQTLLVDGGRNL